MYVAGGTDNLDDFRPTSNVSMFGPRNPGVQELFCEDANRRIRRRLRAIEQSRKNGDMGLREIAAEAVLSGGGYLPTHPVLGS